MAKKCLYVATVVKTHIMEFHIPFLQMLKEEGWETAVAAKNDYENPKDCNIPYCDTYFDIDFARQPFSKKNIKAYKELKHILDTEHYDIVHCHTPVGGVLTRLAARKARKNGTRVIYTAHGFHFYKGAPIVNWLLYFPIEYVCAFMTDTLITINQEDYERAKKHMHAKKIEYIPGLGVDVECYATTLDKKEIRRKFGIPDDAFVILSVGELNKNKNHEVVINSVKKINDKNLYYVIAGCGELEKYLRGLGCPNLLLLGYYEDVLEIYKMSDIFIFPSIREGLGLAAVEAMASGLPLIVSDNRGTRCYSKNGVNAIICDCYSEKDFIDAISLLKKDMKLMKKMGMLNKEISKQYDVKNIRDLVWDIYKL